RREASGDAVVGRKIGFTNHRLWDEYGVRAPIWGFVYASTLADVSAPLRLDGFAEAKIEPEIMFGIKTTPTPEMNERALVDCIAWVAHGFEIVQSIYPGWIFNAVDTVIANALHGALIVGRRHPLASEPDMWLAALEGFEIELYRDNVLVDSGHATNVLGGPLNALRHLVQLLAEDDANPPLAPGEIISTGTLTRAFPAAPNETWTTRLKGIPLAGAHLRLT
ncbi:MAG: 2-oxo-3-hexenedioate decarboxylase, partial [Variibacter sp.]|nr:2-oxo-3-hexenedioate decarboxylase [Variibacter sp.]